MKPRQNVSGSIERAFNAAPARSTRLLTNSSDLESENQIMKIDWTELLKAVLPESAQKSIEISKRDRF
jgi:hypothetical protein